MIQVTETDNRPPLPADHYIAMLAIELSLDDGEVRGSAPVRRELFAPGTDRVRTGLLATMVDLVAGHAPIGPVGPTIDLRVMLFGAPPTSGRIHLHCRPLRTGKRLIVAETMLSASPGSAPFGRALTTFMNVSMGPPMPRGVRPTPPMQHESFDEFLGAEVRDHYTIELAPHARVANDVQATVQGGAQALLAELAAEHALGAGRRLVATDLDMRYLSRLKVGPLVASVNEFHSGTGTTLASVALVDGGNDATLVSHASLTLIEAEDPSGN